MPETQETTAPVEETNRITEEVAEIASKTFFINCTVMKRIAEANSMSRKGILRAMQYALHDELTDKNVRLTNQAESEFAEALKELLTARTIMQAHMLNVALQKLNTSQEEINGEKQN